MGVWKIYHKDGSALVDANGKAIEVHSLEYSDTWMGECFVTVTIENEAAIDFAIGDYLEYRGERFEVNYDPGVIKASSPNTYGGAFKYDSVKFNSLSDELARCEFLDVVMNDNELHYTALPKFSFYVGSLDDLLDRIFANLNEQIGENEWKLYSRNKERSLQRGCDEAEWTEMYGEGVENTSIENKSVTVDQKTCWEALALVNSEWDINFIVRGRKVFVDTTGLPTSHVFKYGKGNGLYELEQSADNDQLVITRLRAYGSDKNLPDHYYADLGKTYFSAASVVTTGDGWVVVELTGLLWPSIAGTYFNTSASHVSQISDGYEVRLKAGDIAVTGAAWGEAGQSVRFRADKSWFDETEGNVTAFVEALGSAGEVVFVSGVNVGNLPTDNRRIAYDGLPNNMACDRLMLPGFPKESLNDFWNSLTAVEKAYVNPSGKELRFSTDIYRPYVDSANIDSIGMRQGSVYFDTDDEANGIIDIYPTMEEMTTSTGQRLDEVYEGSSIDDDGRFEDKQTVANFTIKLRPEIDFNINDLKKSDFSIHFQDGMCGGRDFSVQSSRKGADGCWELTLARQKDDALKIWFPYRDYQIKAGDHFVLTGIELPDSYVRAASLKLLKYAIAYLKANDYTRYVYQPRIDEIYMARQHDAFLVGDEAKSLYMTIKAGDRLTFADADMGINDKVCIETLSIKEEDGKIPTYETTLNDEKKVGTIEKMQNQITSLVSSVGGTGELGILTAAKAKTIMWSEGARYYLSKNNDDTASGNITFEQGIKVLGDAGVGGVLSAGSLDVTDSVEVGGFAQFDDAVRIDGKTEMLDDASVAGELTTKNLTVTGQAHFFELVIDKIKAAGGTYIFSAANSFNVEQTATHESDGSVPDGVVRLYWLAENGGSGSMNTWEVGDQAISMDFNRAKVGTTYEAKNKYWWALVTATSGDTPATLTVDGVSHDYHWIEVSTTDCADGCTVESEIGDAVAQWGSRSDDKKRQAAQMIAAYKSPDAGVEAPCWVQYVGIDSFTITDANRRNVVAYSGNVFKGSFTAESTTGGEDRDITEWLESLQADSDTHFDIWYGSGVPTMDNEPAVEWTTASQKGEHVGDLYFDRSDTAKSDGGHCYRFTATEGETETSYSWEDYSDQDTLKALTKAQNIADDGIITAGTEKMQLLITLKQMKSEFESYAEITAVDDDMYDTYVAYKKAYDNFVSATQDIVSDENIGRDTVLADNGLTAEKLTELYYNYYICAAKMRGDNDAAIKAYIMTVDGKVSLGVTKDDMKTAGIDITDGRVVLDAAKTTVTGDLTVQGALTDSTCYVAPDGTWYAPDDTGVLTKQTGSLAAAGGGLFVPIDMTAIKSVQIQTADPSVIGDGTTDNATALVALPMYDGVDLGCGVKTADHRRSGTHVLIRNAFSLCYTQWSKGDGWDDVERRRQIEAATVYVCADPRLLALENYAGGTPAIPADGRDADGGFNTADYFKGCMYKDGRRGRWLALLPGQEVELVSAVSMWQTGTNTPVPYLVWYVTGGEGLTWIDKNMTIAPTDGSYAAYDAQFVSAITGGEHMGIGSTDKYSDAFFAPAQMSDAGGSTKVVVTLDAASKPYVTIE